MKHALGENKKVVNVTSKKLIRLYSRVDVCMKLSRGSVLIYGVQSLWRHRETVVHCGNTSLSQEPCPPFIISSADKGRQSDEFRTSSDPDGLSGDNSSANLSHRLLIIIHVCCGTLSGRHSSTFGHQPTSSILINSSQPKHNCCIHKLYFTIILNWVLHHIYVAVETFVTSLNIESYLSTFFVFRCWREWRSSFRRCITIS